MQNRYRPLFYRFNLSRSPLSRSPSDSPAPLRKGTGQKPALTALVGAYAVFFAATTYALNDDADKPIQIRSDELVYEERASKATYKGDVTVNQGTLTITAEMVTIEFEDDKVVRLTADGSPAYYSQKLKPDQENMQADARTIVYHTRDERVDLKGNAHLTQEGNDFRGELIEYDIRAGRVDAASSKPERIKMILQPKRATAADTPSDATP